jgi:hypothetical protein
MFNLAPINGRQSQAALLLAAGAAALGAVVLLVQLVRVTDTAGRRHATQDGEDDKRKGGDVDSNDNAGAEEEINSKQSSATKTKTSRSGWQESAVRRTKGDDSGNGNSKDTSSTSNAAATHLARAKMKDERRQAKLIHLAMKSPMYDNVLMLDPQGEVLCTISKKKARWYINKGLADWVVGCGPEDNSQVQSLENGGGGKDDDKIHHETKGELKPDKKYLQIQILFEPKNRSNRGEEGLYVRTAKQNKCVVCGSQDHHMRHYVVPYAYRTLLPKQYKTHLSHDIVILCPKCHLHCEQHRQRRMTDMEDACRTAYLRANNLINKVGGGIEKDDDKNYHHPFQTDHDLYHVRSCALALLNSRDQLPESKLLDYESIIRNHFLSRDPQAIPVQQHDVDAAAAPTGENNHNSASISLFELTPSLLQRAIDVDYKIPNEHYIPGAEIVVGGLVDEELIADFIRDWRRHFLSVAQPRHLPTGWSVNSSFICGAD